MQNFIVKDENAKKLGLYLRKARDKFNYTLEYVYKRTGINTTDLYRIETNMKTRINPFHLIKLADLYELDIVELYKIIEYLTDENIKSYFTKNRQYSYETGENKSEYKVYKKISDVAIFPFSKFGNIFENKPIKYVPYYVNDTQYIFGIEKNGIIYFFNKSNNMLFHNNLIFCTINNENVIGKYYEKDKKILFIPEKKILLEQKEPELISQKKKIIIHGKYLCELVVGNY